MLGRFGKVYLASQSKGRLGILKDAGVQVIVCPTDCDESGSWENPAQMVEDLALRKMEAFLKSGDYKDRSIPAITSDTVVVFDNKVIGKAHSLDEARQQMQTLSGNTHTVFSSYAICISGKILHGFDSAQVTFNNNEKLIEEYLECKEWQGAAGSYRIQGKGSELIKEIRGDINTVIGLPLLKLCALPEVSASTASL